MKKEDKNYQLNVGIKEVREQYFLVENGDRYTKANSILGMRLEIFELSSRIFISNESCSEELIGKARLNNICDSISFFGCDRKLRYLNINICSSQNIKNQKKPLDVGFQFLGCETYNVVEEGVYINLFIHNLQFQKIKHSLEKNLIANIILEIPAKAIEGLYVKDSFSPERDYKILCNKERIINKKESPTGFTETGYRFYKEKFYIWITENLVFVS